MYILIFYSSGFKKRLLHICTNIQFSALLLSPSLHITPNILPIMLLKSVAHYAQNHAHTYCNYAKVYVQFIIL